MTADPFAQLAAQVRAIAATLRDVVMVDYDSGEAGAGAALKRLHMAQAVAVIPAVSAVRLTAVPEVRWAELLQAIQRQSNG